MLTLGCPNGSRVFFFVVEYPAPCSLSHRMRLGPFSEFPLLTLLALSFRSFREILALCIPSHFSLCRCISLRSVTWWGAMQVDWAKCGLGLLAGRYAPHSISGRFSVTYYSMRDVDFFFMKFVICKVTALGRNGRWSKLRQMPVCFPFLHLVHLGFWF